MIRRMTIFGKERMHNLKQSIQKRVCPALCENLKSLASRWKCPIRPECQEFASFMKRAEDNRLSGTTDDDVVENAMNEWHQLTKTKFRFKQCYDLLTVMMPQVHIHQTFARPC
ncbi:hypothetical protein IV203_035768 [Nitzschia inconspicua]|uniref:Uncharacterized protein n=1 Tax=Nitzschia inconspicua TaxID=303405 RepID=A0A9K3LF95_9STRA|nr:hypothetical protein IV203_035768 [Nitzschia inconspicua]